MLAPSDRRRSTLASFGLSAAVAAGLASPAFAQGGGGGTSGPAKPQDSERIDKRPVEELVKALQGKDVAEREVAERELASRKKASIPALAFMLRGSPSAEARASAVRIFRKIGDPEAADLLVHVYKDETASPELRSEAALALGASKAVAALPVLVDGLADHSSLKVCESARAALEGMGRVAEEKLCEAYKAERAKGKDARDGVLYRLLLVLGKAGGEKSRATLVEALRTPEKDPRGVALRHHSAIGLGLTGEKLAIEPLIAALEVEKEFNVSKYIARSLEWLTDEHFPPRASSWRIWWEVNKDKFLAPRERYNPLPPKGIPPGTDPKKPK